MLHVSATKSLSPFHFTKKYNIPHLQFHLWTKPLKWFTVKSIWWQTPRKIFLICMQMITNHGWLRLFYFFIFFRYNWWSCHYFYTHLHSLLQWTQGLNITAMTKWLNPKKDFLILHHRGVIIPNITDVLFWEEKVSHPFIFYWQISLLTHLRGHPKLRVHKS